MLIEKNIQKVIDSTGLNATEIGELIKKKRDELMELISEKAALFLIAKELGVNLSKEEKEEPGENLSEEDKEVGYCRCCGDVPIEEMAEYDIGGRTYCKFCMAEYEEASSIELENDTRIIEDKINKQVVEFLTSRGYKSRFLNESIKNDFTGDFFPPSFIKSERDYELKGVLYYNPESNKIRDINIPIDNGTGVVYKNLEILHTLFNEGSDSGDSMMFWDPPPIRVIFIGELVKKLIQNKVNDKKVIIRGRVTNIKLDDLRISYDFLPSELKDNPFVLIVWNFKFIEDSIEDEDTIIELLKNIDHKVLSNFIDDNSKEIDSFQFSNFNLKNFPDISEIDLGGIYEIVGEIHGYTAGIMFNSICFKCLSVEEKCKCVDKKDIRSLMDVWFNLDAEHELDGSLNQISYELLFLGKIAKDLLKEKNEIISKVLESNPNSIGFRWDGIMQKIFVKGIIKYSSRFRKWVIIVLNYSLSNTSFNETQGLKIITQKEEIICKTRSPDDHPRASRTLCIINFYNFNTMEFTLLNSRTSETSEDFKSIFLKTLLKIKKKNPEMRYTIDNDFISRITIMNLDSNNNNLIIKKMKELLAKQTNNNVEHKIGSRCF